MTFMEVLPMIVYLLLIVFLIVLIVLGIKMIFVVDKTDKLLEDVQNKVSSLDNIFKLIDFTSSKLTTSVTSLIDTIFGFVKKIFNKRKEEEYYE